MRGPDPLLLIEVADSSLSYDLKTTAAIYATHGVRDHMVVDAVRETIRVHREPQGGGYRDVEEYEVGDEVVALLLPEVGVRLVELD